MFRTERYLVDAVLMTIRGSLQWLVLYALCLAKNIHTFKSFSCEEMENVSLGEGKMLRWVFLVADQQWDSGKHFFSPIYNLHLSQWACLPLTSFAEKELTGSNSGVSVQRLRVPFVPVWVYSRFSHFLPQSKNWHIKLIRMSNLSLVVGIPEGVNKSLI